MAAHARTFEDGDRGGRPPEAACAYQDSFVRCLEIPAGQQCALAELVLPMVQAVHLNIAWYEQAVERERWFYRGYLVAALALVLLLPVAVLMISAAGVGAATLAALLVGLFALYTTVGAMDRKRQAIGNFWRAASALKSDRYAFEDTWRGKATHADGPTPAFTRALTEAVEAAHTIRQDEQHRFFEQFSRPTFDVAGLIGRAGSAARKVVPRDRDPATHFRAATEVALQRIETEMAGLGTLIKKREQQLDRAEDDDDATQIQTSISALEQRHQVLELALLKEQAMLEGTSA